MAQDHPALEQITAALSADSKALRLLSESAIGLEKESLRVNARGQLAKTPHPAALGAALTHTQITTDYSEAQLELITPKMQHSADALAFLTDLHTYIYQHLGEEILWSNSMPCVVKNEEEIPIAQYGSSNLGQLKHIYRQGLKMRYGSAMQIISGVHFNYSIQPELWQFFQAAVHSSEPLSKLRQQRYMGMVRNLLRLSWMIPYLFGASPAVCKAFVGKRTEGMQTFDKHTLFDPAATSLRMGNVGYQNNKEIKTGLAISYNSLAAYVASLNEAVSTPYAPYQTIGIKQPAGAGYWQLNANILQIENEYYATVRPKHTTQQDEMSLLALHHKGIEYIELRSLDINTFAAAGITLKQLYFLEVLFLFCLFTESEALSENQQQQCSHNEIMTAHQGRDPKLLLQTDQKSLSVKDWGLEICQRIMPVAELLDRANGGQAYQQAVQNHQTMFLDREQTLSARVLDEMQRRGEGIVTMTMRRSQEYRNHFLKQSLSPTLLAKWDAVAQTSSREQQAMEDQDNMSLDDYMKKYFSQLQELRPSA